MDTIRDSIETEADKSIRKAKLFGMSENCLKQRGMRLKFLTLTQVWAYIGELVFNMLILVGSVKMSDRIIREMVGL